MIPFHLGYKGIEGSYGVHIITTRSSPDHKGPKEGPKRGPGRPPFWIPETPESANPGIMTYSGGQEMAPFGEGMVERVIMVIIMII